MVRGSRQIASRDRQVLCGCASSPAATAVSESRNRETVHTAAIMTTRDHGDVQLERHPQQPQPANPGPRRRPCRC